MSGDQVGEIDSYAPRSVVFASLDVEIHRHRLASRTELQKSTVEN